MEHLHMGTCAILRAAGLFVSKKWIVYRLTAGLMEGKLVGTYSTRKKASHEAKLLSQVNGRIYIVVDADYIYQPVKK